MLRKGLVVAISVVTISLVTVLSIEAQQEINTPQWIMKLTLWWEQGLISNDEYHNAIDYLVDEGIIPYYSPKPHPTTFLVTPNDLDDSWTLEKTDADWKFDTPNPAVEHIASANFKHNPFGTMLIIITEFGNKNWAMERIDESPSTVDDKKIFTFADSGKCEQEEKELTSSLDENVKLGAIQGNISCVYGNYNFFTFYGAVPFDTGYLFMDKMIEKFFKSQGKEFNVSTKEASKNANIIPERELTYEEKFSLWYVVDIIDCQTTGNYVTWKGSITSYHLYPVDVKIILTGKDINDNILTFEEEWIINLNPEQTKYIDRLLDDSPGFDTCGYTIEEDRIR